MFFKQSKQIRGLVDCDSFFASCMIAKDPSLRGKIVCVGHDIIIARSYNAKPYGISIGTPVREAKKLLPKEAVILQPDFTLYKILSGRLMRFLRDRFEIVEQFSIDEAFFTIETQDSYENFAKALQYDIKKIIGIPVSIGVAPTRLLAKFFADYNKPFGTTVATNSDQVETILQKIPFKSIPFIGPKSHQKLSYRCHTAHDFFQLPYNTVKETLGGSGIKIRLELRCVNAMNFTNEKHARSIGRSYSFNPHFTNEKRKVREHLLNNIERAVHELLRTKMKVRQITVSFRTQSFERFSFKEILQKPINDRTIIIHKVRILFEKSEFGTCMYRSTGIHFSGLVEGTTEQVSLFDNPEKRIHHKQLNQTIHDLNNKYGPGTIRAG